LGGSSDFNTYKSAAIGLNIKDLADGHSVLVEGWVGDGLAGDPARAIVDVSGDQG